MKMTLLCLLNTALLVAGQMLFKLGSTGREINSLASIVSLIFNPVILTALCLYAGTTLLWLYILSKVNISFAYPIQALAFPVVLILASVLFHETIPLNRWLGVAIIFIGVFVAVR